MGKKYLIHVKKSTLILFVILTIKKNTSYYMILFDTNPLITELRI